MNLISVIVAFYNQEKYLSKCINSILKQSYSKLQIILVDDGSNDKSCAICDEYSKRDSRIETYHLKNGGVSKARNFGLSKAKGDFVVFIDGDDCVKKSFVKDMYDSVTQNDDDMVICQYERVWKAVHIPCKKIDNSGRYTTREYLENTLKDAGHHYFGVVWNKIYRADVIRNNNILFRENVELGEDFIFNIEYWKNSSSVKVIDKRLYLYNKNGDGASQKNKKDIDSCKWELYNRKQIYKSYEQAFKELGLYDIHKEEILFYLVGFYIGQSYDLERTYLDWSETDRQLWQECLDNDEQISDCRKYISEEKMREYTDSYIQLSNRKKLFGHLKSFGK